MGMVPPQLHWSLVPCLGQGPGGGVGIYQELWYGWDPAPASVHWPACGSEHPCLGLG